jgi:hypothetical protein
MWLSGNVGTLRFKGLNKGEDYRFYTGSQPLVQP